MEFLFEKQEDAFASLQAYLTEHGVEFQVEESTLIVDVDESVLLIDLEPGLPRVTGSWGKSFSAEHYPDAVLLSNQWNSLHAFPKSFITTYEADEEELVEFGGAWTVSHYNENPDFIWSQVVDAISRFDDYFDWLEEHTSGRGDEADSRDDKLSQVSVDHDQWVARACEVLNAHEQTAQLSEDGHSITVDWVNPDVHIIIDVLDFNPVLMRVRSASVQDVLEEQYGPAHEWATFWNREMIAPKVYVNEGGDSVWKLCAESYAPLHDGDGQSDEELYESILHEVQTMGNVQKLMSVSIFGQMQ